MSLEAMKQALEALEFAIDQLAKPYSTQAQYAITALHQAIAEAEKQEPVAWESLLGAIARGWCYEKNANKTMDSELALAIAKEVSVLFGIKDKA